MLEVVRLLLAKRADMNATTKRGRDVFSIAAAPSIGAASVEMLETLKNAGATMNRPDDRGLTPLDHARRARNDQVVAALTKWLQP